MPADIKQYFDRHNKLIDDKEKEFLKSYEAYSDSIIGRKYKIGTY